MRVPGPFQSALSDIPGEDTVKLFCPSCLDVYVPPNSRFQTVDGAFFGRTFGALFLLTFPEYDLTKRGADILSGSNSARIGDDGSDLINGMYARNIAPRARRRPHLRAAHLRLPRVRGGAVGPAHAVAARPARRRRGAGRGATVC